MASSKAEIEHVHIVFLGGRNEHVDIALSEMDASALHIITSDQYEKEAEAQISKWCKKYSIRQGTVEVVSDIFEQTAVESLIGAVYRVVDHESELGTANINWLIGITGGTQLMGAVASYASNLIGATPYYVSRIKEGDEFLLGGVPILFPDLSALGSLQYLKHAMLQEILVKEKGRLADVVEQGADLFHAVNQLKSCNLVMIDGEKKEWSLTEVGKATISAALEKPETPPPDDDKKTEDEGAEEEKDEVTEMGECVVRLREISEHNCYCPLIGFALNKQGITARTEIWSWENQDYLLLRYYDSLTDEPKDLGDSDGAYNKQKKRFLPGAWFLFEEKRLPADVERLVAEIFDIRFDLTYMRDFTKEQVLSLMEGENIGQLIGLISNLWLAEKDLISDSEVKIPDTGIER